MEAALCDGEPVCCILRGIRREDHIHRAVGIGRETRAVIHAVAADGIIDQEIVIAVSRYRPESVVHRRRKTGKMQLVGSFPVRVLPLLSTSVLG